MYVESGSVSYMREALALQLFKQAGVPCADAFYVRLYLNGNFYGLYLAVEDIDKRWLARRSFPNTTLLLKSEHYKYRRDCRGGGYARPVSHLWPLIPPSAQ